jgi:hypothetical protein
MDFCNKKIFMVKFAYVIRRLIHVTDVRDHSTDPCQQTKTGFVHLATRLVEEEYLVVRRWEDWGPRMSSCSE